MRDELLASADPHPVPLPGRERGFTAKLFVLPHLRHTDGDTERDSDAHAKCDVIERNANTGTDSNANGTIHMPMVLLDSGSLCSFDMFFLSCRDRS